MSHYETADYLRHVLPSIRVDFTATYAAQLSQRKRLTGKGRLNLIRKKNL
jgi:hypothetical protein